MKGARIPTLWTLATLVLVLSLALPWTAFAAVWTDKPDYAPGEMVAISGDNSDGAGYLPGETVRVDVAGPNGYVAACEATADDVGAWSCQVTLWADDSAIGQYTYYAAGLSSNVQEQGTFTDAQPARVAFSTDAPCAVTVAGTHTNPGDQSGKSFSGSTSFTINNEPFTEVTFIYQPSVTCGGVVYDLVSASPTSPLTAGESGSNIMVIGAYVPACTAPSITSQPSSVTKTVGDSVTFSVAAAGDATLSYQWYKDNTNINGATSSSYSIDAVHTADAGNYTVHVSNECGNITSEGAVLTVNKALLTVTAADQNITYGDPEPAFTFQYSGFVAGDSEGDIDTLPTCGVSGAHTDAGTYTIVCSGGIDDDYDFSYVDGTLTVEKATLTVTADNQTKILNAPNPAFTFAYAGWKYSDDSSVVDTPPTCSSPATQSSPVGSYSITCAGGFDNNYDFSYIDGTLKIMYASGGMCYGSPGHTILQPINPDGSSIFKQKSTVPAKFRVCDAYGNSIGTPGVVSVFRLIQTSSGTESQMVNEPVDSTTPDTVFRWSSSDQQWIFNINTKNLSANRTYYYQITLNDESTIEFHFGLK